MKLTSINYLRSFIKHIQLGIHLGFNRIIATFGWKDVGFVYNILYRGVLDRVYPWVGSLVNRFCRLYF